VPASCEPEPSDPSLQSKFSDLIAWEVELQIKSVGVVPTLLGLVDPVGRFRGACAPVGLVVALVGGRKDVEPTSGVDERADRTYIASTRRGLSQ
jgi:hypothetical protein